MAQSDVTIYDENAGAPLYRRDNRWEITVSGYNNNGDFVYRMIRVPIDASAEQLGEFMIETLKGYRRFGKEESARLIEVFNETVPDEEFETGGDEPVAGIYRDGKVLRIEARWKKDDVYKSKLPLNASAGAIGAALLEGYAKLDQKYPKLRDAEKAAAAKRKRRVK